MKKEGKLNFNLINLLLVMLIIYLLFVTSNYWAPFVGKLINVLIPFFLAFVFAYILDPFVKFFERKGVRKKIAVFVVLLIIFLVLGGILVITVPMIYDQLLLFAKSIVQFVQDISTKFDLNLGDFQFKLTDTLNEIIKDVGKYISTGTIDILGKSVNVLSNAFIISVVGIYFLFDMDKIRAKVKAFLKTKSHRTYSFVKKLDHEMTQYFHGLALLMLVTLIEYSVLFRLVNHPNWMILGVLMAILTIIPYFGGIITNAIAIITASVTSVPVLIGTILVIMIFSGIDGYIISPKIYGKTNNLSPVGIIFAVGAGGTLFGVMGIVVAVPLYVTLHCIYKYYQDDIKDRIETMMEKEPN